MSTTETTRLERLWSGEFGDAYVDRNLTAYGARGGFWLHLLDRYPCESVLEVGCNVGGNLQWIAQRVDPGHVHGVDVNDKALAMLRQRVPGAHAVHAPARDLPFVDASIDLVCTVGVLIHQPEESLPRVMDEVVRVARRYVLCAEYADDRTVEVHYRGHEGALFRRDYGGIYVQRHGGVLRLVERGFLTASDGFDDTTWWLFEKP